MEELVASVIFDIPYNGDCNPHVCDWWDQAHESFGGVDLVVHYGLGLGLNGPGSGHDLVDPS